MASWLKVIGLWQFYFSAFLDCWVFYMLAGVIRWRLAQYVILLPDACTPGVAKLFWRVGCTVIYRLRLWSATVPARLLFSLADTLRCFKLQTLCLPSQSYYSSYPTFPFGAKYSIISALCWAPLLSLSQVTRENDRTNGSSWQWPTCLAKGTQEGPFLLQYEVQNWARCCP